MDELILSELVGLEKDKVSSEVTIRILEARVKSLLSQLQAVNLKSSEKDVKMKALEDRLKEQSQDRVQMLKQLGSKETQMNKLQTSVKTMQSRLQHLERVEFDLRKVLACYKALHRTRQAVFSDDAHALEAGRQKIREEFIKHSNEKSQQKIKRLLRIGWDSDMLLRKTVVQARMNERGHYEIQFRPESTLQEDVTLKTPPD